MDEPFLYYTQTVYQPKFSVGQIAVDLSKSKEAQSSLSAVNLETCIKSFAIASALLTLILVAGLVQKDSFFKRLELITRNLFELNLSLSRSFGYLGFVIVFYNLYFMIFKGIISSNIKTNKVIVNASLIVDSLDDLSTTIGFFRRFLSLTSAFRPLRLKSRRRTWCAGCWTSRNWPSQRTRPRDRS